MINTEKQLWLESVVNNLGKALLTTDLEGRITYLNDLAMEIVQVRDGEAIGLPLCEALKFYNAVNGKQVNLPLEEVLTNQTTFQSEQSLKVKERSGNMVFATCSISPIQPKDDCPVGTVVVVCTYENELKVDRSSFAASSLAHDPEQKELRNTAFYTKREGQFVRVMVEDVLWIEAMENYVQLVTEDDRYLIHTTMKKIAERLESQGFVRVHRSYIVPIDRVDAIEENRLYIAEKEIPIGKSYRQDLIGALTFI